MDGCVFKLLPVLVQRLFSFLIATGNEFPVSRILLPSLMSSANRIHKKSQIQLQVVDVFISCLVRLLNVRGHLLIICKLQLKTDSGILFLSISFLVSKLCGSPGRPRQSVKYYGVNWKSHKWKTCNLGDKNNNMTTAKRGDDGTGGTGGMLSDTKNSVKWVGSMAKPTKNHLAAPQLASLCSYNCRHLNRSISKLYLCTFVMKWRNAFGKNQNKAKINYISIGTLKRYAM